MRLYDRITASATRSPNAPALVSQDGQVLDFAKVRDHVAYLGNRLRAEGIQQGHCVATLTDNVALRALLRFALISIGADVPVVFQPAALIGRGQTVHRAIAFPDQDAGDLPRLDFAEDWLAPTAEAFEPSEHEGRLIFSTSGSTGLPKFMRSTVSAMLNLTFRAERNFNMVWGPQLVMVPDNTLPATIALLRSMHSGHLFLAPRETADASLRLASDMGVRQLFVTPMSLRDLVDAAKAKGHGLTTPRITMFGAMADRALMIEAREIFGPEIDVFYGTAENGLAGAGRFDPDTHVPGWCGRVAEGTDLVIRDNGHLAYRIPADERNEGYIGGPDFLDAEGWFETSDLATLLDGKTIVLRGREDNLINLGGSKFAAELVEMLACDFPFIREAVALQLPENTPGMPEMGVAVVADANADLEALRLTLAVKLRTRAPITVRSLPSLPRLPSGKVDRRAALAALTAI